MTQGSLQLLYRDENLVVVGKPSGMLVHRSKIDFHEPHNLIDTLRRQLNRDVYPVHRLDKPTSGLLIVAFDRNTARSFSAKFEQSEIKKSYIAVVRGFTDSQGRIEHPVRDKDNPKKKAVPAITCYRTIGKIELPYRVDRYPTTRYSLLTIQPLTGRRHQIRQHMKHIHHPLIGDTSYGKSSHNRLFAQLFNCRRLLLHAVSLKFRHPHRNLWLTIHCRPSNSQLDHGQFARVLSDKRWMPAAMREAK